MIAFASLFLIALFVLRIIGAREIPLRLWGVAAIFAGAARFDFGSGPELALLLGIAAVLLAMSIPDRLLPFSRWAGVTICVFLIAAATFGQWWRISMPIRSSGSGRTILSWYNNKIRLAPPRQTGSVPRSAQITKLTVRPAPVWTIPKHLHVWKTQLGFFGYRGNFSRSTHSLGLGFVLVVFIFPTLFLWKPIPSSARFGHCQCGYDLHGNQSGVCPECGRQLTAGLRE